MAAEPITFWRAHPIADWEVGVVSKNPQATTVHSGTDALLTILRGARVLSRCMPVNELVAGLLLVVPACNSIRNGWLDPTVLGAFDTVVTVDIRSSLTLEDMPIGLPGALTPTPADLQPVGKEYPITPGDTLMVEINELRERQIPYQAQVQVSSMGYVNLPVVGRLPAAGLTTPEFEESLVDALREQNILLDPEVTVNPQFLQAATYSIFGVGVSASSTAPLRAGTFPIRRPDLRILEAINLVGGLNEFVTDVYVFRYDELDDVDVLVPDREADGFDGDLPAELEPDPTQPYIYVSGEFKPNPAYAKQPGAAPPGVESARAQATGSLGSGAPAFDNGTPAVSWARVAGDSSYRIIRIPADLLRSGDPEVNIFVRGGDVIRIVSGEIGVYYVMGQVNRVGAFAFNAEPITLKAAIAAAGGLSGLAWPDRCTVYRRIGQREQMIQVNLDRIFAGQDSDFLIKRGDIINIGTHPFAPFLQRIRSWTLPNPLNDVGYSFRYSRNFADIDSFAVQQNPSNRRR